MSISQIRSLAQIKSDAITLYVAFLQNQVPERYYLYLNEREKTRAEAFKFDIHRGRYILSQGILRVLLGHFTHTSPENVNFSHGHHGKPALAENPYNLHFNISHTEDVAIFGFAYGSELGVDVESKKRQVDIQGIAERYFTPEESQKICSQADEIMTEAFFNAWTRKEAFLKAIGEGLYFPLNECEVTVLPEEQPRIVHIQNNTENASKWQLHTLSLAPHYLVAVAYEGEKKSLFVESFPLP